MFWKRRFIIQAQPTAKLPAGFCWIWRVRWMGSEEMRLSESVCVTAVQAVPVTRCASQQCHFHSRRFKCLTISENICTSLASSSGVKIMQGAGSGNVKSPHFVILSTFSPSLPATSLHFPSPSSHYCSPDRFGHSFNSVPSRPSLQSQCLSTT